MSATKDDLAMTLVVADLRQVFEAEDVAAVVTTSEAVVTVMLGASNTMDACSRAMRACERVVNRYGVYVRLLKP